MNIIDFSDATLLAASAETCVKIDTVHAFVTQPNAFLARSGRFWHFIDKERNSPARLLDDWFSHIIVEYIEHGKDIGAELYPTSELRYKQKTSIDDLLCKHLGNKFILTADLEHFYDNINFNVIEDFLPPSIKDIIRRVYFYDNGVGVKCGLRASSFIADIVGTKVIDKAVKKLIYERGLHHSICYNRYCDDLLISGQDRTILRQIEQAISAELRKNNFKFNHKKTKLKPINSNSILGRNVHNGKILISKQRRNRARIKYYNALKAYNFCNRDSLKDITKTLHCVESALGLMNYIKQYNQANESTLLKLKEAYSDLQELKQKGEDSPFIDKIV